MRFIYYLWLRHSFLTSDISRRQILQASATAVAAAQAITLEETLVSTAAEAASTIKVAKYILARLKQYGLDTVFGVPGATWEGLFSEFGGSGVSLVITSGDLEAAYAADG